MNVSAEAARRFFVAHHLLNPARSVAGGPTACWRSSATSARSSSTRSRSPAGATTSCCMRASPTTSRPGATCCTSAARSSRRTTRGSRSSRRATSRGSAGRARARSGSSTRTPGAASRVLERIRADGPLSSADFERERGPTTDWFGAPTNTVRAVLEAYAVTGVLGLARREGNRRYYDLLERLLPADALAEPPLRASASGTSSCRGTAPTACSASAARTSSAASARRRPTRGSPALPGETRCARSSSSDGELVAVKVEGVSGKRFVVREDVELLAAPPEPAATVAFLSPFDALVWDRKLLGSLFGFDYVWELFIPPDKRRWGWYVLPVIFGDRFVGRIEPRDRPGERVRADARRLVGGRFRSPPCRRLRGRDARGTPRVPPLRRRGTPRVGIPPRYREAPVYARRPDLRVGPLRLHCPSTGTKTDRAPTPSVPDCQEACMGYADPR